MKYLPILALFLLVACGEVATENSNDASVTAPTPTTTTTAPDLSGGGATTGVSAVPIKEEGTLYTVAFSNRLTRNDLDGIQRMVEDKGMKLVYDSLEFTPDGYLDGIGFSIDLLNGTKGTGTQYNFDETTNYGFTRDFSPAGSPLSIGDRD